MKQNGAKQNKTVCGRSVPSSVPFDALAVPVIAEDGIAGGRY
jgi:hypothetical protein